MRTALYNYLLARKHGGQFILRIEDTDQGRYVPGAEGYIIDALRWVGLLPDEGVGFGGDYGPYRQSDRKAIYHQHAHELVQLGNAYYAFDTPESLEAHRASVENFTYNHRTRDGLHNSLTLSASETQALLDAGTPYVVRLKVAPDRAIVVHDLIRGEVVFQSNELDDKVLLKADGMPTYHLANIVDDHLMHITHVIRGEEWLPSTAHHVLLYEGFGWVDTMPKFAHLPLIMKPEGHGKLSKRDGAKFGFPVFPLEWNGQTPEDYAPGFRSAGFLPEAVLNFLALLGWHPGGEREIYALEEMVDLFSLDHIAKGGARFDYEKAKWFNQQYIKAMSDVALAEKIRPLAAAKGYRTDEAYLQQVSALMKERVTFLQDFVEQGYYLFEPVRHYDAETLQKKWNPGLKPALESIKAFLADYPDFEGHALEAAVKQHMVEQGLTPGDMLPLLRIALAGTMKGPAVFDMAAALGRAETIQRLDQFLVVNG